jgi:hypothetical protein
LKINDAHSCEREETHEGQQLVTPLHFPPCNGGLRRLQMF